MYCQTLLPGFDFGDTGSFQTIATLPLLVPRHAYPLYFALSKLALEISPAGPAFTLNALSAITGAAAVAAFAWLTWEITGSAAASSWAALMLAGSYTFWSQAIIAEVYTLHVLFIALVLVCAVRWRRHPSAVRLAALYGVYALSFGNHLGMILFAPALLWLLRHHAWQPRALLLAIALASAGALQYAWNFEGLWHLSAPRPPLGELVGTFWFDVTKADWRETLVGAVPPAQLGNRAAMYWWDLRQQFGLAGVAVALAGAAALFRAAHNVAFALAIAFAVSLTFGFFYNVGDSHVFLLPSHVTVAVFAGAGAALLLAAARSLRRSLPSVCTALLFAIPLWRIADTWPAVDRSRDTRPTDYAESAVSGLSPQNALYAWDFNWQLYNGINYFLASKRPELPRTGAGAVLWRFSEIVERSHALGRDVVLTTTAAERISATYGRRFEMIDDPRVPIRSIVEATRVPANTPYVLVWMTPLPIFPVDREQVSAAVRQLAGRELPQGRYAVVAGLAGRAPVLAHGSERPFRLSTRLGGRTFTIRIDAWLPFDTMRRAGFGHVIPRGGQPFTAERGLSFVAFDDQGGIVRTTYLGGLFTPQRRLMIPVLR
jgi:hypothetical protein